MTDVLPPFALYEDEAVRKILSVFGGYGYRLVSPPLAEFEDSLLHGAQSDIACQTFRLMDPVSGKVMGIRADVTPQIGRVASTRLKGEERPLRLAYRGHVLRVNGTQFSPARQVLQVGAELIGADGADADAEILLTANETLKELGIEDYSFDLNLPTLFPALCRAYSFDRDDAAELGRSLDEKDFSAALSKLRAMGKVAREAVPLFEALFQAYGECGRVARILKSVELPPEAAAECRRLIGVVEILRREAPDMTVTLDVLENRGFEYHCGIAFSVFSVRNKTVLGRGGRYIAGVDGATSEPACGVTFFMENILNLCKAPVRAERIYVPSGTPFSVAAGLREKGYAVIRGLKSGGREEARRLSCDCIFADGGIQPVK